MNIADRIRAVQADMLLHIIQGYPVGTMTGPNGLPERDITAEATLIEEVPHALEQSVSSEDHGPKLKGY